jgi:hypothetical protein
LPRKYENHKAERADVPRTVAGLGGIRGLAFEAAYDGMDMKPKERAKAIAEQLDKSDRRKWPALIEAAIRDAENDIVPASLKSSKANMVH